MAIIFERQKFAMFGTLTFSTLFKGCVTGVENSISTWGWGGEGKSYGVALGLKAF